eukprot:Hpha_TRINITY_DN15860_c5_g1::TRINITY_DN15860_c5_g1_i28::g.190266::m.190266
MAVDTAPCAWRATRTSRIVVAAAILATLAAAQDPPEEAAPEEFPTASPSNSPSSPTASPSDSPSGITQSPTVEPPFCTIKTLHASGRTTCVTDFDNKLRCWGANSDPFYGTGTDALTCVLGLETTDNRTDLMGHGLPYVDVPASNGTAGVGELSIGVINVCAMTVALNELKCWGHGSWGGTGVAGYAKVGCTAGDMGTNIVSMPIPGGCTVLQFVAAYSHSCLLCSDRVTVYCWGGGSWGSLGSGSSSARGNTANWADTWPATDLGITGGVTIQKLIDNNGGGGTSSYSTCILTTVGGMKCWGRNDNGELGYGDTSARGDGVGEMGSNLPYVTLPGGRTVQDACKGMYHITVLYDNNDVETWGDGSQGQRGDEGGFTDKYTPSGTPIDLSSGLASETAGSVHCGQYHVCVLSDTKQKFTCWGKNEQGQLGLGHTTMKGRNAGDMASLSPLQIGSPAIASIAKVALGFEHSCILSAAYYVYCWGSGEYGQTGLEGTVDTNDTSTLSPVNLACPTVAPTISPTAPTISPTSPPTESPELPPEEPTGSPTSPPT